MATRPVQALARLAAAIAQHRSALGDRARVAFVLHPGGAAGAYQAGALTALVEHGLKPDLLVGTSIGAFNGLGVLLDAIAPESPRAPWPPSRLGRLWRRLSHRQEGSALLLDKPCLVGYITGRPDWNRQLLPAVASRLPHLGEELSALSMGLFTSERLRRFTLGTIAGSLELSHAGAEATCRRLAETWTERQAAGLRPPTLVAVTSEVATHRAVPFVLGDPAVAARLFDRGHAVRMLGHGTLAGAAMLDPLVASASIPGVFPPVALPPAVPEDGVERHVDGAIANAEPFHLAIDAGATFLVSFELESAAHGAVYVPGPGLHFVGAAAESFMTVQDHYQELDARNVAHQNRRVAEGHAPGKAVVPLYRLAPIQRQIGLLEFDGRYDGGALAVSLFDWFMTGYGDAGGHHPQAWLSYHRGQARHGDTLYAIVPRPVTGWRNATYLEAAPLPTMTESPLHPLTRPPWPAS